MVDICYWTRPGSVPFPNIWRKFKGKKELNGIVPSFWVQDIPEDEFENVTSCMVRYFCREEPVTKHSDFNNEPESVQCRKKLWDITLAQRMGLICYMENPNPNGKPIFAAVNCTYVQTKYDPQFKLTGKTMNDFGHIRKLLTQENDPFETLETDVLLCALGMYVFREFRGQDLGLQLLLARENICRACDITATGTVFTSTISQELAHKAGYKTLSEISYRDLRDIYKYDYPGIEENHKSVKYMYKVF
ncbi:hypothetical protein PPYR_08315 [Photinus pyralis]|uniref:N-acetyltransferase domain-containing protein n=1 Tax=Photinus pyralis TaxID=7054 RepID=A0A5N4AJ26_PHOPY|nr:uncharacterized protein LOC116172414 isoform X1 [Photinus pyralis]KAB0797321.1 hypothetical protein PPYR_08315 [Photinus pyralis]